MTPEIPSNPRQPEQRKNTEPVLEEKALLELLDKIDKLRKKLQKHASNLRNQDWKSVLDDLYSKPEIYDVCHRLGIRDIPTLRRFVLGSENQKKEAPVALADDRERPTNSNENWRRDLETMIGTGLPTTTTGRMDEKNVVLIHRGTIAEWVPYSSFQEKQKEEMK